MNKKALIAGIVLILMGSIGATIKVDTTWHYFGNGVVAGIGVALLLLNLYPRIRKK